MAWSITFVVTVRGRIITDVNSMVERSTLAEYHRQRQRNADRKMTGTQMKIQLEQSRKAAWNMKTKLGHDRESVMREQSRIESCG